AEGYAPIVGSGFNSTVLHYAHPVNQVKDGDVVVLDVGGQYSGYVADITRTLPANGKFTPRQREIYEVVLGAQNAVLAALKPGMSMGGRGENSLGRIATEYMNAHGKDKNGEALGKYFIHGLGHHIGLYVHDVGPPRPLEPGMVVTIEPGIYIPDENLGVRIEDIVLITETGYKLLTERLPRTVEAVERAMASGKSVGLPAVIAANVPFYPPLARQARISGVVELRISTDGTAVSGVQVESGHPILAAAAVGNARTWQFRKHTPLIFKSAFRFQVLAAPDCQIDSGVVQLRLPTEVEISAKPVITCDPAEVRALKQ
ncbi:MAG: M24 family metallopeptidase, partial [Candidatus Acidiferrales bacterium]